MTYRLLSIIFLGLLIVSCGEPPASEPVSTEETNSSIETSTDSEPTPAAAAVDRFIESVRRNDETVQERLGCIGLKPSGFETLAGIQSWRVVESKLKTAEKDSLARYADVYVEADIAAMGTAMQSRYVFSVWAYEDYYQYLVRITEGISNPQRRTDILESFCITKVEML